MMNQPDVKLTATLLRQALQNGRCVSVTVISNSMAPLIRKGDVVCIRAAAAPALQPGDIVLMETGTTLLSHRFWRLTVEEGEQWLHTRGSKPLAFDPPRPARNLVGRIVARQRGKKQLDLERGWGGRLNKHLQAWDAWENRFMPPTQIPTGKPPFWRRVRKSMVYAWAALLTAVVGHMTASPTPDKT